MKKTIRISGTTSSIITFNKVGLTLQGALTGTVDIFNEEQEAEIKYLESLGLIKVEYLSPNKNEVPNEVPNETPNNVSEPIPITKKEPEIEKIKETEGSKTIELVDNKKPEDTKENNKKGRPKGSKDKSKRKTKEALRAAKKISRMNKNLDKMAKEKIEVAKAEKETQAENSRVVISTGDKIVEGRMKRNFAGEIADSQKTKASLDALDKLENEGNDQIDNISEDVLDPSEQIGRKAIVSDMGTPEKIGLKNSIIPENEEIKKRDPFIDDSPFVDDNFGEAESNITFIDKSENKDDDDNFIEI